MERKILDFGKKLALGTTFAAVLALGPAYAAGVSGQGSASGGEAVAAQQKPVAGTDSAAGVQAGTTGTNAQMAPDLNSSAHIRATTHQKLQGHRANRWDAGKTNTPAPGAKGTVATGVGPDTGSSSAGPAPE